MLELVGSLRKKIFGLALTFIMAGVFFVFLGFLVVKDELMLRVVFALFILTIGYIFLYVGYKFYTMKRELDHFLRKRR